MPDNFFAQQFDPKAGLFKDFEREFAIFEGVGCCCISLSTAARCRMAKIGKKQGEGGKIVVRRNGAAVFWCHVTRANASVSSVRQYVVLVGRLKVVGGCRLYSPR